MNFKGVLKVRPDKGFITTPVGTYNWVKEGYKKNEKYANLFTQSMSFATHTENVLNTPYFHRQLFSDFTKTNPYSKYVGSAYLLLNSLPFVELTDKISFIELDGKQATPTSVLLPPVRVSSLFREIGSTHYVPYHLIVKWGSIYHRYKKKILDGVDILDGFLDSTGTTKNINANLFFNSGRTDNEFTVFPNGFTFIGGLPIPTGATFSNSKDIGIHPFYDAIYHQVVNGYNHYEVLSGNTSYFSNVINGGIKTRGTIKSNGLRYWTSFVDNSKFNPADLRYTPLPCDGDTGGELPVPAVDPAGGVLFPPPPPPDPPGFPEQETQPVPPPPPPVEVIGEEAVAKIDGLPLFLALPGAPAPPPPTVTVTEEAGIG